MRLPLRFRASVAWVMVLLATAGLAGCVGAPAEDPSGATPMGHAQLDRIEHVDGAEPAPGFEVVTVDGQTVRLSDLAGQVVLVEFMGAGCSVCRRNLPHHFELYDEFVDDGGFSMVALDVWHGETEDELRAYRDEHQIPWPMAMAPRETEDAYEVTGTPNQFFIDRAGNLHSKGRYIEADAMIEEVRYLLAGPAPGA